MTLHPVLVARFAERDRRAAAPRAEGTVAQARLQMAADRAALGAGPKVRAVDYVSVPTRAGPVAARVFRPLGTSRASLLYLHGGGWVMGSLQDYEALARALAARTACDVWLLDYRLAPEHPFPAALEDAEDALLHLAGTVSAALPLIVAGDSAGGNLAAVVALTLRHEIAIAMQLLLYPVTDCGPGCEDRDSYRRYGRGFALDTRDIHWFLGHYATGQDLADPRISPLRTADLRGAPSAWIATAGCDVLCDEAAAYARRLHEAGVPVALHNHADMAHGFAPMFNILHVADGLFDDIAHAMTHQLPSPS